MSRAVAATRAARIAGVVGVALAARAPGRAVAQSAPPGSADLYIAGKALADDQLVIERVGADGKLTELFRGGAPTAWQWRDAHTLIELFDQDAHGDADIAWIIDGRPDPARAVQIENASWPVEAQGWSQQLSVHHGQVWLVRERPPTGTRSARPVAPVFRRVDVTPNVVQREPPDHDVVASADDRRAWLDHLPSVKVPKGAQVARTKARIGTRTWGAVQCRPARGAPTTFPSAATHPFLRVDVAALRYVSPTLPLYVVSGMAAEAPDGPRFDTAAFLGCTRDALHTFAWGGGDVFLTIIGAPGGAGFSAGDPRKMQLWMAGREVAKLPVLIDPVLSGAADAPP